VNTTEKYLAHAQEIVTNYTASPYAEKWAKNGRVEEHPLYGQKFKKKNSNKIYTVNSVNIHFWDGGYYWFVVFEDEKGSSAPRHWENINSTSKLTLECIKETQEDFTLFTS